MANKTLKPRPDEIACLYEISNAIHATLDLKKSLYRILDLMEKHLGMNRGSIAILNPDTSEIILK